MAAPKVTVLAYDGITQVDVQGLGLANAAKANAGVAALPSDDPLTVAVGAQADAAATTDNGIFSLVALFKRLLQSTTSVLAKLPALGTAGSPSADVISTQFSDLRPVAANITAADVASASTSGMNAVALITGAPTAGSTVSQALNGHSSGAITVSAASGFTGIIEGSADGGTSWAAISGLQRGYAVTLSTITGLGVFSVDVTGLTNLRVRGTAGTATIKMAFSSASGMTKVLNPSRLVDSAGGDILGTVTASPVANTLLARLKDLLAGTSSTLNITVATVIKGTPGRLVRVSVLVPGTTDGTVNDCTTTGAAAASNQFGIISQSTGINIFDWPCGSGIVVVPGTGQTLAVSYS